MVSIENPVEIQLSLGNPIYRGPEGKPGKDGIIGRDGKSAYEIAVENGFEGTETEWLESLKGKDGIIGRDGAVGPQGEKGDTPVKGVDYFTEQDIEDFIAQVPQPDLSTYNKDIFLNSDETLPDEIYTILHTWNEAQTSNELSYIPGYNLYFKNRYVFAVKKSQYYGLPQLFYWDYDASTNCYCIVGILPSYSSIEKYNYHYLVPSVTTQKQSISADVIRLKDEDKLASTNFLPQQFAYIKENYATKNYVEQVVAGIETGALKRSIVSTLPSTGIDENTIYMVANSGSGNDAYDEYLYVNNRWEKIGSSAVDLTDYATKNYVDTAVGNIPAYTLPTASTSTLGGVKVDGSTITIADGVISATSSGGGSSYTAGDGISIDSNNVISAFANPLIHSMLQMTTAGSNMPSCVKLDRSSTWEEFVSNIKAGRVVYVNAATSYTFSENYKLTAELLGISTLYGLNVVDMTISMMSSSVSVYSNGTQIYYSTYYYFDGTFLWCWKKPEDLGNFIKVRYRNSMNTALGYALQQITTDMDTKFTAPTAPTTDGTYFLTTTITSGTPAYSWENVVIGGSY